MQQKITDLIKKHSDSPAQHSKEWHEARSTTIGGSDIAKLSTPSGLRELVKSKVGLTSFAGNTATRWGTLFENVTRQLIELIYSTTIIEFGSVRGPIPGQRYSPDGLAAVRACHAPSEAIEHNVLSAARTSSAPHQLEQLVLFEFKSPLVTIPDGKIPTRYVPQLQTGLCTFVEADYALFVNAMYRKCKLADFNLSTRYDTDFHSTDQARGFDIKQCAKPVAIGVIWFFEALDVCKHDLIDVGLMNAAEVARILDGYDKQTLTAFVDAPFVVARELLQQREQSSQGATQGAARVESKHPNTFAYGDSYKRAQKQAQQDGLKIYGYLSWKLMKLDIIRVERVADFLEQQKGAITSAVDMIKTILASSAAGVEAASDDPIEKHNAIADAYIEIFG